MRRSIARDERERHASVIQNRHDLAGDGRDHGELRAAEPDNQSEGYKQADAHSQSLPRMPMVPPSSQVASLAKKRRDCNED